MRHSRHERGIHLDWKKLVPVVVGMIALGGGAYSAYNEHLEVSAQTVGPNLVEASLRDLNSDGGDKWRLSLVGEAVNNEEWAGIKGYVRYSAQKFSDTFNVGAVFPKGN